MAMLAPHGRSHGRSLSVRMPGDDRAASGTGIAQVAYLPGDGIIWRHIMGPASLLQPSYWPRLVRRFWEILHTERGAVGLWDRAFPRGDGEITCPSVDMAVSVIELIRRFEPRRLPRPRSREATWPCGPRCSRLRVCRPRAAARPLFARRWKVCGKRCGLGWNPNWGPHSLCRCHPCEVQERRAIARRIAEYLVRRRAGQEQPQERMAIAHHTAEILDLRHH